MSPRYFWPQKEMVSAMANDACITPPHFQRYIQAPVLHGKWCDFPRESPQARHIAQIRVAQRWSTFHGHFCSMQSTELRDSNRSVLNNDSHWERRADLQTLLSWNIIPCIETVSICSGQTPQTPSSAKASAHTQTEMPTTSPRHSWGTQVRQGGKIQKFKKAALTSPAELLPRFLQTAPGF